jgi:transposase
LFKRSVSTLQNEGIESHVVDAASIATPRRRRRAKTDKIDGETLVRVLLAYKPGEPRSVQWSRCLLLERKTVATSAASAKR